MKRLIILFLLAYATSSFAQVPFEVSKSCFVVNGALLHKDLKVKTSHIYSNLSDNSGMWSA